MSVRTDLAVERLTANDKYIENKYKVGSIDVTKLTSTDGSYKETKTFLSVEYNDDSDMRDIHFAVRDAMRELIKKKNSILVVGLGNELITPDSLGPKTAARIIATRHIDSLSVKNMGIGKLKSVAVISPGVLGQTGIETSEIIKGTARNIGADVIVVIDALAAADLKHLCRIIQITDSGISPGSGVGNSRKEISETTMGIPIVALGIPTVIDIKSLTNCSEDMIVTHSDIDLRIDKAAEMLGHAVNCAFQPDIDEDIIRGLF